MATIVDPRRPAGAVPDVPRCDRAADHCGHPTTATAAGWCVGRVS